VNYHATVTKTVEAADRFAFGENWTRFARLVDESRIAEAEASPRTMLATDNLQGRSFLDIGSGSGLFSLAAARLGGGRIHSFDDDAHSVSCTSAVRDQFLPTKQDWLVEECDITDDVYCTELRVFGIVYARGVLHHTGSLWHALENTCGLVKKGGLLFGSIYDQRRRSERWAENQAALQRRAGLVAQAVRSVRIRTGELSTGPGDSHEGASGRTCVHGGSPAHAA
jgi:2-polyprenyl-3-methyl-5-hydroxy-6-metoxy-1,4-benzoquinol methylase